MKIATWNLERLTKSSAKRNQTIINILSEINADILILTETNEIIQFSETFNYKTFHSASAPESYYKEGEKRVSIYSKYDFATAFATFRDDTSICKKIKTLKGNLAVYGTVIGINGNRRKNFIPDLDMQIKDFENITQTENLCISGDLNMSFSDNYYYTKEGREKLNACFEKLSLTNLTANIPQNIDHIILPNSFIQDKRISIQTWNLEKKLSDHIGVAVDIFLEGNN